MAVPEGATKLGTVGIAYKGVYDELATYKYANAVYYNGSTYIALIDNPAGFPSNDGVNWRYLAQGFLQQAISELTVIDESGILGEVNAEVNAQEFLSKIAELEQGLEDTKANKADTLDTLEEIAANTEGGRIAGALAVKELNSNLSKANQGVGAISSSGIQDDRFTIPSGAFSYIPFSIDRKNTNTDVFTSADGLGCLIKQSGLYSVRVKLHMYLVKDHNVDIRITRYQQGEEISIERITIIGNNEQYHEDRTFILEHNASGDDRFNVQIMSDGSGDFIYGASEAADSVLEVIKIANV